MKIFILQHNVDVFKFYLEDEDDPLSTGIFNFSGESLVSGWKPYKIYLFNGKTKAEKALRDDINTSCFNDGVFYATEFIAKKIKALTPYVELLNVTSDSGDLFFINVTRKIPSLLFKDRSEIIDMDYSSQFKFIKNNVINEMIFRDEILSSTYFVTERFVDSLKNDVKGIEFKEVGEV